MVFYIIDNKTNKCSASSFVLETANPVSSQEKFRIKTADVRSKVADVKAVHVAVEEVDV